MSKKYGMLFVQGQDRPGIIQAVTTLLFKTGANLEDVSMTLLEGQFAMMISFQTEVKNWMRLENKILDLEKAPFKLNVDLVAIKKKAAADNGRQSVLISAIGKDRTGIVYRLSSDLAKIKANITNLECRLLRGADKAMYSLALEVDLKSRADFKKVEALIKRWQKLLGIEVKIHSSEAAVF